MKILHLEHTEYHQDSLKSLTDKFDVFFPDFTNREDLLLILQNDQFDFIFTKIGMLLDKEMLCTQKKLKAIVTPTTGINHIDNDYCLSKGIKIISLHGEKDFLSTVSSTAEHAWCLAMNLARSFKESHKRAERNSWDRSSLDIVEIRNKTIGIIGFGRLGKMIANYANAFSARVIYFDINSEANDSKIRAEFSSLNNLLSNSDFIFLMANYSKENLNMLSTNKLRLMKPTSFFINVSRGELIDQDCLYLMLKNKKIRGAALDVLYNDSAWSSNQEVSNNLIELSKTNHNLIITPHIGGYAIDAIHKTRKFITDKFLGEYK